ncbi:hypothetical protein SAMN04487996_10450 [Dyadobacter soli]|uniref:Uncharacterized protein n=1 Tax=Dyadobacter soli TaxID=659014 RepID=A0A1G7B1F0_9BACT|nr:hypothetical protein [Dyadobacter soli]SDE20948.1 hypothetical protein SAMN04487996_10450 [Dyadobacter soli]
MEPTSQNSTAELADKLLADTQAEVATLKAQVEVLETEKKSLEEQIAGKDARITELTGAVKEAETLVLAQQAQLAKQPTETVVDDLVVTYKKGHYRIAIPSFHFKGENYTADQLKDDQELIAKLIDAKSGVLVPVKK